MKKPLILLLLLSLVGMFDTLYLTYEHYNHVTPPCSLHAWLTDCGKVLSSSYATFIGFPISILGIIYYGMLFILIGILMLERNNILYEFVHIITVIGLVAALYFITLQIFLLHAICLYCMLSDSLDVVIFFLFKYLIYKYKPPTLLL